MSKRVIFFMSLIGFILTFKLSAQPNIQKKGSLNIRLDGLFGFVIPEYQHINYVVNKPVHGFELSFFNTSTGKSMWEQMYKFPEAGLTFQYTTLGNDEVLGKEFAIFPYVLTPFIRRPNFVFSNQFGLGLGYATKKFDLQNNYENISVGSHVNIHFNFKLGIKFRLYNQIWMNIGSSFTHYSNANMAEPNLGINLLSCNAGINYRIGAESEFTKKELLAHQPKHEYAIIYAAGGKHTRALQSKVFFTSSISCEYKYHWKRKLHIGGGFDLSYDSATETEMNAPENSDYKSIYDYKTGFHISQEIVYERFSFILQEGIYVGLKDRVNRSFMYNRAILRWKFNNHILMHISMRSHLHILDYPEIGFGYYFVKNR